MRLFSILLVCFLPVAIWAQDSNTNDDRGVIIRFLEDNLSSAGRDVRITGFKGALSSQATLEELTISDHDGVWFTLRDAVLDWDRRALLSGRLVVNKLTAKEILLPRRPITAPSGPSTTAGEFALPDLPVSIEIGDIAVDSTILGKDIFGQAAEVSFKGSGDLISGKGSARLTIQRIDGPTGHLRFQAGYDNVTTELELSLLVEEGDDGILTNLLNLPDTPPLKFSAIGSGPLAGFVSEVSLDTDGQSRLAGLISIDEVTDQTVPDAPKVFGFSADFAGDITPLFAPEYQTFFGSDVKLKVRGQRFESGRLELDELTVATSRMQIDGSLSLLEDGLPKAFSLAASISDPAGTPVLLPLSGPETFLRRASITAGFQSSESDDWNLGVEFDDLQQGALRIGSGRMSALGKIQRIKTATSENVRKVLAEIKYGFSNLTHENPAIAQTLGPDVVGDALLEWTDGKPLQVSRLSLSAGDVHVSAQGDINGLTSGYELSGRAKIISAELARFAELTGYNLQGGAELELSGRGSVLGGKFDLGLTGSGQDIGIGIPDLDPLIAGSSTLNMAAARNENGTALQHLEISTDATLIQASGLIREKDSELKITTKLDNLARIVNGFPGPANIRGLAQQEEDSWNISFDADGPGGTNARISGKVRENGNILDLAATGKAPLALLNDVSRFYAAQGTARFDLTMSGAPSLGSLSGTVSTQNARVVFPSLNTKLVGIDMVADLAAGTAVVNAGANVADGGRIAATGTIGLLTPNVAAIDLTLSNVALTDPLLFRTKVSGDLQVTGPLAQRGQVSGTLDLGLTEIQLATSGISGGSTIPRIVHLNEPSAVRSTRAHAGLIGKASSGSAGPPIGLNILIRAANRVFIRGRGLDAELQGELTLSGSSAEIVPIGHFDLVRGRLDILGKRLDLEEGLLTLQGSFGPTIRLVAATRTDEETVRIITEGTADAPVVSFSSEPELPEEEVLARLLFGRGISQISPLQAAQLAAAVATLTGQGGGVVNKLRERFGLDDLDVATNPEGETALKIGKYISDNIYTDIIVDSAGKSEINLNLDITDAITAKGRLQSTGGTGVGIFFEKDY